MQHAFVRSLAIRSVTRLRSASTRAVELPPPTSQLSLKELKLRDYQERCVTSALSALRDGHRRIGVSAPTGSGKTLMIAALIDRLEPVGNANLHLVIVSGLELAKQVSAQLQRLLPEKTVELEQGKHHATGRADITVATIQSVYRRLDTYEPELYKAIIIDEAHHAAANTYMTTLEHFDPGTRERFEQAQLAARSPETFSEPEGRPPPAETATAEVEEGRHRPWVVGFTATFTRADRLSLRRAFDHIAEHIEIADLIEQKWLSQVSFESVDTSASLDEVVTRGTDSDFVDASLSEAMRQPMVLHEVVMCYKERAAHRRSCLVFAVDVKHTIALLEEFRKSGVQAGYIIGEMGSVERQEVMQLFRSGELPVLVNCNVLTEGTDIPEIDTVILARPTRSKARYWQMVGRGLRISPDSGKTDCLVLDFDSTFPGLIHWPALMYGEPERAKEKEQLAEEAAERSVLEEIADTPPRSPDDIRLRFDPFDPFALSPADVAGQAQLSALAWVACGPKRWVLDAGLSGRLRISQTNEGHTLQFRPGLRYSLPITVAEGLSFQAALQRGDKYAFEAFGAHTCTTLLAKEARWRTDAPTRKQVERMLKLLGDASSLLSRPYSLNKGEIASAVTALTRGGKKALIARLELRKSAEKRRTKEAAAREAKEVPLLQSKDV